MDVINCFFKLTDFAIADNPLPGIFLLDVPVHYDGRGKFVKTYNQELFNNLDLEFNALEAFYSSSSKNVLRGMHYQTGDSSHAKLVNCLAGSILDVVVGVDPSTDAFNKAYGVQLDSNSQQVLLIGKGYAHGFLSLDDNTLVSYMTSTIYNPMADTGVLWNSIAFDWPTKTPIISERDENHPVIQSLV